MCGLGWVGVVWGWGWVRLVCGERLVREAIGKIPVNVSCGLSFKSSAEL